MSIKTTEYLIKSIFIGNTGTGKSSIIDRYINNTFDTTSMPTIGVEFFCKLFCMGNTTIKLHIWDLAGGHNFKNIIRSYYRHARIVFFVFDKTNRASFLNFEEWIKSFEDRINEIQIVFIANKCDLSYPMITTEEALEVANKYNAFYYETSAKNNINIKDIFEKTVKIVHDKIMNKHGGFHPNSFEKPNFLVTDDKNISNKTQSSCC